MGVIERALVIAIGFALAAVLIALLSGFFAGQDPASVGGGTVVLGTAYRDQGDALLAPGTLRPSYDSDPPSSGAHVLARVPRQGVVLADDQLLTALAAGNVVVLYGSAQPPAGLAAFARAVGGPYSMALAAGGQAVIYGRRPGISGLVAVAWTRILRLQSADDPALRSFTEQWLGRGAPS